jgi:putative transposase
MPRLPRIKTFDSIFHIMVRSISDVPLYREDKDKDKFLKLVKKYQDIFGFKVYAYCLMTTHGHLIIDANGADISKIMHGINQCYAQYFNRKYNRHGHVFQDRFKSKIIKDERYLINLSAYIHNNPKDMKRYKNCIEKYKFSTLGVYLGLRKDLYEIVDEEFVMQLFSGDVSNARKKYLEFVHSCNNEAIIENIEFKNEKTEYRSERSIIARDHTPESIKEFVARYTGIDKKKMCIKHNRSVTESKALCIFMMRCFCNFTFREICQVVGCLTQARVSKLCSEGLELICSKKEYENIIEEFLKEKAEKIS